MLVVAVYLPPSSNTNLALGELYKAINKLQTVHPEGFFIIDSDFNHTNLKSVFPKFYQYVDFGTRGENCLEKVYTNVHGAHKAVAHPHISTSDHAVMLLPAYASLLKCSRRARKTICLLLSEAVSALQDFLECMDWSLFRHE